MSTFRQLAPADLAALAAAAGLDALDELQPVAAGIENSNWFARGRRDGQALPLVLTLVEAVPARELPFFVQLADRLQAAGLPVPAPLPLRDGARWLLLQGLPALLLPRLPGAHAARPDSAQCRAAGAMLARLHLATTAPAAADSVRDQPDWQWWPGAFAGIAATLATDERHELDDALQRASRLFAHNAGLPRGIVHGDFFRDNVLLQGAQVSGVLDLFHATRDVLAWDLAIALNDWSLASEGAEDAGLLQAFSDGYEAVRPLQAAERKLLGEFRAAAAARFWLSRHIAARRKDPAQMQALWRRLVALL